MDTTIRKILELLQKYKIFKNIRTRNNDEILFDFWYDISVFGLSLQTEMSVAEVFKYFKFRFCIDLTTKKFEVIGIKQFENEDFRESYTINMCEFQDTSSFPTKIQKEDFFEFVNICIIRFNNILLMEYYLWQNVKLTIHHKINLRSWLYENNQNVIPKNICGETSLIIYPDQHFDFYTKKCFWIDTVKKEVEKKMSFPLTKQTKNLDIDKTRFPYAKD